MSEVRVEDVEEMDRNIEREEIASKVAEEMNESIQ